MIPSTNVVDMQEIEPGIARIKMQEKTHKNMFSKALIFELMQAFEKVRNEEKYKVVILTGYDSYFATGGMQEDLFALQEGKGKFTDLDIYSLPLECPIPVISAMQGHAIGGGLVMGLYADFVLMSKESIYSTNFMKYGFTPGVGATLVIPEKLGLPLSQEMLMLGSNYKGEELEKRGLPFPIYSRSDVNNQALKLARELAKKPRVSLITLKDQLVKNLRNKLPQYVEDEVKMHDKTFFQPEVRENIRKLFGN